MNFKTESLDQVAISTIRSIKKIPTTPQAHPFSVPTVNHELASPRLPGVHVLRLEKPQHQTESGLAQVNQTWPKLLAQPSSFFHTPTSELVEMTCIQPLAPVYLQLVVIAVAELVVVVLEVEVVTVVVHVVVVVVVVVVVEVVVRVVVVIVAAGVVVVVVVAAEII
ncbi:hypothetical protein ElyMa_004859400 [Elysia marginata]|uniref:Uncharacterized protein n=1 Tax=Elysia marginata TaxID=1093978 RepID=A0AAV4IQD7_9GAST|nr:hypothetical protein ElyMa_004859400 [Elysia marginata]